MLRSIDADALICKWKAAMLHMVKEEDGMHPISMEVLIEDLEDAPTIEAEPRWIPVTERLPEDGEMVVAIVNGEPRKNIRLIGAYQMATYYRGEGWIVELFPEWMEADVTHWMPLPEPPEDGGT